ncbi:MAG TPA: GGDEF domain-containing protein [Rhodopila sp.]
MRTHEIPPTPRNFAVWFAYCSDENPPLQKQIDQLIKLSRPFNVDLLDKLHQDFFADSVDLVGFMESSHELRQIAGQMAGQVTADQSLIGDYGATLQEWIPVLNASPTIPEMQRAVQTLSLATAEATERMHALEQLFTISVTRIGELNEQLARLEKEATRDALTGLANRRLFDKSLMQATLRASKDATELALLFLDIDHFKKFNDTFGHPMGDSVLRLVGQVLSGHIKGRDLAARYGGEEFAVILMGTGLAPAKTVGEQIRALLESRPIVNRATGQTLGSINCSIGVAVHRAGEAAGSVVDRADRALYKAKRTGRNRVCTEDAD